jgi:hypothetical protein
MNLEEEVTIDHDDAIYPHNGNGPVILYSDDEVPTTAAILPSKQDMDTVHDTLSPENNVIIPIDHDSIKARDEVESDASAIRPSAELSAQPLPPPSSSTPLTNESPNSQNQDELIAKICDVSGHRMENTSTADQPVVINR